MSPQSPVQFPELPQSELEQAIGDLVDKAHRVLDTQGRLRQLLTATRAVGEGLDLPTVLRRITRAAVELVGAQYGALGVIGADGELEQFIHVGLDDEAAARIGHLPRGRGLLGTVISDPRPIRLEHLGADPRSYGFPAEHPPMESFVGVPIRVRDQVFGNLYLTNRAGGSFTEEDEELLSALAASAGVAIDNARLFGEARRRQQWATASAETGAALLSTDIADPLRIVAEAVARLTDAAVVSFVGAAPDGGAAVEDSWGDEAEAFRGRAYPAGTTISETVIESGNPRLSAGEPYPDSIGGEPLAGPTMVVPIRRPDGSRAALLITRPRDGERFQDSDLDMAMDFATHASVALELRAARLAHERLALLEDRSRIARDLHDNVIQRIFAAGLALNGVDTDPLPETVQGTLDEVATLLDEAVAEIRLSVFALRATSPGSPAARPRLLEVVGSAASSLTAPARVVLEGDLDLLFRAGLLDDVEAVVREGLSNAARHAHATAVVVSVIVTPDEVLVAVVDDGRGPGNATRSSGLASLTERAREWGGTAALRPGRDGGSVLDWRVPRPVGTRGTGA